MTTGSDLDVRKENIFHECNYPSKFQNANRDIFADLKFFLLLGKPDSLVQTKHYFPKCREHLAWYIIVWLR